MRILAVLALVAIGCGDDDSGDGSPLTVDELPGAYRSATCRHLVACGQFPDRSTCLSANVSQGELGFDFDANLIAAIKAGRVQLDSALIATCLATIGSLTCDSTAADHRTLYRCTRYLQGTAAAGAPCFLDAECLSGQCSGGNTQDTCVTGTCVGDAPPASSPAEVGMPCTSAGCVDGAFCDANDTFTCVPLRRLGESCVSYSDCEVGLGCAGNGGGTSSCKPLPVLGEPCPDLMCRDLGTYCAESGRCERTGLAGDACSGESFSGECAPHYPCDPSTNTCTRGPGVAERCAETSFVRCFDAGLVCDGASSTCIVPRDNGEFCTIDAACKSEHCDTVTSKCAAPVICF